jgi:hypothetical protein
VAKELATIEGLRANGYHPSYFTDPRFTSEEKQWGRDIVRDRLKRCLGKSFYLPSSYLTDFYIANRVGMEPRNIYGCERDWDAYTAAKELREHTLLEKPRLGKLLDGTLLFGDTYRVLCRLEPWIRFEVVNLDYCGEWDSAVETVKELFHRRLEDNGSLYTTLMLNGRKSKKRMEINGFDNDFKNQWPWNILSVNHQVRAIAAREGYVLKPTLACGPYHSHTVPYVQLMYQLGWDFTKVGVFQACRDFNSNVQKTFPKGWVQKNSLLFQKGFVIPCNEEWLKVVREEREDE